jgi:hypothetical protein
MGEDGGPMTDEIQDGDRSVGERSMPRLVVAGLTTLITGLLAAGLWVVAQAQYLNDYCSNRAPQPKPSAPEALDGRPAHLDGPVTVRCDYDDFPAVVVTDALPLVGALVLAVLVLGVAFLTLRWARLHAIA